MHDKFLFIISMHCGFVVRCFKCFSTLKQDWFWLAVIVFMVHQLENCSESDSSDIVVPVSKQTKSCIQARRCQYNVQQEPDKHLAKTYWLHL